MVSINLKCWTRYRYSPTWHIKINKATGSKYKFYYHYYNCHSNTLILIFSREIKFYKADNDSR